MHRPGMNSAAQHIFSWMPMKTVLVLRLCRHITGIPIRTSQRLKNSFQQIKGVPPENIFLGNGSDECIDLIYRAFCNPGKDNVIIHPPTYGMYEVSAHINDVEVRRAMLTSDFELDLAATEALVDENTKIIWICSPNNPTGNAFSERISK